MDIEALHDIIRQSLKIEKLSNVRRGLTIQSFFSAYSDLFTLNQETHEVKLIVSRKRALEDNLDSPQRKRYKRKLIKAF